MIHCPLVQYHQLSTISNYGTSVVILVKSSNIRSLPTNRRYVVGEPAASSIVLRSVDTIPSATKRPGMYKERNLVFLPSHVFCFLLASYHVK